MSPIRVDFYLLESNSAKERHLLCCRLIEKAYARGHRVFIYCSSKEEAELIDELLWTFKDDSFIPHNLQGEGPEPPPAVQIGYAQEPRGFNDILINMQAEVASFHKRFCRIIEIVGAEEEDKALSRQRFRYYRQMQYVLHTHNVVLENPSKAF